MSIKEKTSKLLENRFGPVFLATLLLCSISLLTRITLLIYSAASFDWSILNLLKVLLIGLFYDLAAASFAIIPLVIYLWLFPAKGYTGKTSRVLLFIYFFVVILTLIFNAVSEWFFWEEFSVRYNFIAVDYLVYTTEVIGNIRQSYPINTILAVLVILTAGVVYLLRNLITVSTYQQTRFGRRTKIALILLCLPVFTYFCVSHKWKNNSSNQYVNELSGNGMYEFGYAFWHNQLDYDAFYKTLPIKNAANIIQHLLPADPIARTDISTSRMINNPGAENKMNVVLISVESLSAEFLGTFGNTQHITPQLDSLAKKGLLFNNLYASGTRTVRGLEALSLCIPPTPGQSIVKRPDNKNLFTLGSIFRSKGYNSRFIYGGYGYFDNMNEFFSNNGYQVTDRSALQDSEIHYSNIWGVADEDLFTLSLRELDKDYKDKKPFFAQIMTVSNHRPYTYPEGRIDIPSHTGREGAVKYTDYAIGKFIREAKQKPWFANTLFVIVADHCASSAGKVELPVDKYHIPMIFYSPGHIVPGKFEKLTAQIDIGPTILGYLNFSYNSKFFGQDVFKMKDSEERAFISTYQSLGYIKNNKLVILDPNKKATTYKPDFTTGSAVAIPADQKLINEAISNYQMASYLYQNGLYGFDSKKKP
ncbi:MULTISPECIES: LTA synthase family protein [unclassified Pedobacter]|uniref:LTA synthase family protein n=1 Tax=unclassified Pedobacter TaxID=2628915 RepID=UPI00141FA424|nr:MULTISPECIES: LTA synthase family protein [unclassified Pedobacter]NII82225.1 phosphoglycerol transferase MdoB-like AlkP superfamily enzyme [Pedobacter sp. SG908]NMN36249.1 phosphoglycerol transferase MdoB-like AlkP superfamily enzyme [Pedobacter sp. SG918]